MDGDGANGGVMGPRVLAPEAVRRALPASPEAAATVRAARERLRGLGPERLRLAGPERLVDPESAFACARALRREARALEQQRGGPVLVMRTFVEALVHDPLRDGSCDLNLGLATARLLLLRINELGLPCAIEAPDPQRPAAGLAAPYLEDLVVCAVPVTQRTPRAVRPLGEDLSGVQLLGAPPQSALADRR